MTPMKYITAAMQPVVTPVADSIAMTAPPRAQRRAWRRRTPSIAAALPRRRREVLRNGSEIHGTGRRKGRVLFAEEGRRRRNREGQRRQLQERAGRLSRGATVPLTVPDTAQFEATQGLLIPSHEQPIAMDSCLVKS